MPRAMFEPTLTLEALQPIIDVAYRYGAIKRRFPAKELLSGDRARLELSVAGHPRGAPPVFGLDYNLVAGILLAREGRVWESLLPSSTFSIGQRTTIVVVTIHKVHDINEVMLCKHQSEK